MNTNQTALQTALPFAMLEATSKLQAQEPKPLVNLKRAIFDACKVGDPFDSAEMIETLGKFGYKPNSVMNTLKELYGEGKLRRSQKAPYAYTKLRSWINESDKPLQIRTSKPKEMNLDEMPRIPPITAMTDALACMMEPSKVTTFGLHDIDLVMHHLNGMKVVAYRYFTTRDQYHPDDVTLAHAYAGMANDLQALIDGMHQTRSNLLQISRMAAAIRSMS